MKKLSLPQDSNCLFSFVQISDTHCLKEYGKPQHLLAKTSLRLGKYAFHWRDSANSFPILESTLEYINQKIKPDFLIHSGDITECGKLSNLEDAKKLLAKLNCSCYPLMGDNDGKAHSHSDYVKVFGQRCYSFNFQNWHIIILSAHPDNAELDWLKKDLSGNVEKPIIFATHHLIVGNFVLWLIEKCLRIEMFMPRAREVLKILKDNSNVRLVLSGHCHTNFHWKKYGIDFISTAALVETPHRFKLFQVYRDKMIMTLFTANTAKDVFNQQWFSRADRTITIDFLK